jgi:hypothetical protein
MKAQCQRFVPRLELLEARNLLDAGNLAAMPAPWVQVFHGDFNGDGKQDVAGIDSSGQWWVSLSTGTSFSPRTKWAQWSVPSSWSKLLVADVNGDGKDDIVGFGTNGDWFVGLSNGTDTFTTGAAWAHWSLSASWDQVFVGDFNGDHKADIAGIGNNGAWFVGLSNGTNTFATGKKWAQWSIGVSWSHLVIGDFNGDGKKDVAGLGFNGKLFVGLSNGADTFTTGTLWAQWSVGASWSQLLVGDFNGDKIDDIAGFGVTADWFVGLSNGTGQFATQRWDSWGTTLPTNYQVPIYWTQVFVADVNGDGKSDIVGFYLIPPHPVPELDSGIIDISPPEGVWYAKLTGGGGQRTDWWSPPSSFAQLFVADFTGMGGGDIAGFSPFAYDSSTGTVQDTPAWNVGRSTSVNQPDVVPTWETTLPGVWQWAKW